MQEVFVLDNAHSTRLQSEWVQGPAEANRWGFGVKVRGKVRLAIVTFRCDKCGYLESYAPPE